MTSTNPLTAGDGPASTAGSGTPAGRIEVHERAIHKVCDHVAAGIVGVTVNEVRTWTADHRGGLALRVETPIRIPPLDDTDAVVAAGSILDTANRIQRDIQAELTRVVGRPVTRVDLRITGAVGMGRGRVR